MDWCRLSRAQSSTDAVVKFNGSAFDNQIMLARCTRRRSIALANHDTSCIKRREKEGGHCHVTRKFI